MDTTVFSCDEVFVPTRSRAVHNHTGHRSPVPVPDRSPVPYAPDRYRSPVPVHNHTSATKLLWPTKPLWPIAFPRTVDPPHSGAQLKSPSVRSTPVLPSRGYTLTRVRDEDTCRALLRHRDMRPAWLLVARRFVRVRVRRARHGRLRGVLRRRHVNTGRLHRTATLQLF